LGSKYLSFGPSSRIFSIFKIFVIDRYSISYINFTITNKVLDMRLTTDLCLVLSFDGFIERAFNSRFKQRFVLRFDYKLDSVGGR